MSTPTIIEGQWTGKSTLTKNKKTEEFLDLTALARPSQKVKSVEEQGELESRRIWKKVSEALKVGDYATASAEKSSIENQQRTLRKEREQTSTKWEPSYFKAVEGHEIYGDLREKIIAKADAKFLDTMGEGGWMFKA